MEQEQINTKIKGDGTMEIKIREANIDDVEKGLLEVFIDGYRYHQNGRPDIFKNLSDKLIKIIPFN